MEIFSLEILEKKKKIVNLSRVGNNATKESQGKCYNAGSSLFYYKYKHERKTQHICIAQLFESSEKARIDSSHMCTYINICRYWFTCVFECSLSTHVHVRRYIALYRYLNVPDFEIKGPEHIRFGCFFYVFFFIAYFIIFSVVKNGNKKNTKYFFTKTPLDGIFDKKHFFPRNGDECFRFVLGLQFTTLLIKQLLLTIVLMWNELQWIHPWTLSLVCKWVC